MSKPEGFHTITPYLMIKGAAHAIEFYKKAFGATELMRQADADGAIRHAEIRIGDSPVMLVDECSEFPEMRAVQTFGGSPMNIFLYVDDADAWQARALAAGATEIMKVEDKPYGRSGGVKDPFGLDWWVCS
jgi:PhnB protein